MKNNKYVLIIFFLMFTFSDECLAQNYQKIDSLKLILNQTTSDSIKIDMYKGICWEYVITRSKPDTARLYADSLKLIFNKNKGAIALSNYYHGVINRFEGNYNLALKYLHNYLQYYEEKNDTLGIANGLYQIGVIHYSLGNYNESLKTYYRILDIYKAHNKLNSAATTLNSIGHLQRKLNKHQEAIKSYEESINIHKSLDKKLDTSVSLESLANTYGELMEYDNALKYYNESLSIALSIKKPYRTGSIYENLGNLNIRQGHFQKALNFYFQSYEIRKILPSKKNLAISLFRLGNAYTKLKKVDLAQDYLLQSLALAQEIKATPLQLKIYPVLIESNDIAKKINSAYKYLKVYTVLKDSILYLEKNKQLLEIETKYQTAEKDKEIILLTSENKLKEKESERQDDIKKVILMGLFLTLLLAGLVVYTLRQKLKNQKTIAAKNEEIKISNLKKELSTLEMKALRAQMNPHFLFNCMNSINTMILRDDNANASKYLTKFSKLVRLMLENSENPKVTLQDELEMLNAYIALESIRFKGKIDYTLDVSEAIDIETTLIPSMILQPFVENAIWHGLLHNTNKKGKLSIKVYEENDVLHFSILDNGVGRASALQLHKKSKLKKKSMGIKITTERLTLLTKEKIKEVVKIIDLKDDKNNPSGTQVDILIPIS